MARTNYADTKVEGDAAEGAAAGGENPIKICGWDGTNVYTIKTDNQGRLVLGASGGSETVNVAQINGVTVLMGNGVTGTGSQRVTVASDNTPFAVKTDQTTHGTTDLVAADLTKIAGTATSVGNGVSGNGVQRVAIVSDNTAFSVNAVQSGTWTVIEEGTRATYAASITALAPAAAATDIFTLTGSGTKTIRITRIQISGVATAAGAYDILLIKRSAANSAGTSSAPAAVPHDSTSAAGTATILAYTANPTLGAAVGTVQSRKITVSTAAGAIPIVGTEFALGLRGEQPIFLRGTAEVLAINLNGATMTGGSLDIDIEWTEV